MCSVHVSEIINLMFHYFQYFFVIQCVSIQFHFLLQQEQQQQHRAQQGGLPEAPLSPPSLRSLAALQAHPAAASEIINIT